MSNKINLYVNSKNRKQDETTSKFSVVIPDGLLCVKENEYFTLSIISFHIYNQFYNIRSGYNDELKVIDENGATTTIYLDEGSYNALSLLTQLNDKLTHIQVSYDKYKNKYSFHATNKDHTLVLINCHQLLGFEKTTSSLFIAKDTSITSHIPINLITDTILNIAISGDVELQGNNLHNYRDMTFEPSNIIFQKYINSIPYGLSLYSNEDGANNYKYVLNNKESINYFTLELTNQNLEKIADLPDFFLTLQFEKHEIKNINAMLETIINYMKNFFQMLGLLLEHFKIF
jgi:hypothetical protein